jgi:predicted nucleic acid-binding protein
LTSEEIPKLVTIENDLNLDFGESEAIVLALRKDSILLSNDRLVKKRCKNMDIEIFNLEDIISFAIEKRLINNTDKLLQIITAIESKDRIKVRNKQYLLEKLSK